jgi:hypothetical protein
VLSAIVVVDDGRLAKGGLVDQELERRFDEIQTALLEQRQYTEFAFGRLSSEMRKGFERFEQVDQRFEQVDKRFDRLERKLDQFIDVQSRTNELVDRRLTALERERGRG